MIKIAIIADVHGNDPALSAVLEDATAQGATQYIFAGDYIFDLPYTNEVAERIQRLPNAVVVRGNKEHWLELFLEEDHPIWQLEQFGAACQAFRELTPENRAWLAALPDMARVALPSGGCVYVAHYLDQLRGSLFMSSSRYRIEMEKQPFTHAQFLEQAREQANTDEARAIIAQTGAEVVVMGHSHVQWYADSGGTLAVNPGSCGQPLDFDPRAAYTLLTADETGLSVEECRVAYEIETVIAYARASRLYEQGPNWCELVFKSLREGQDNFLAVFKLLERIKAERGEQGPHASNEAWREAVSRYLQA